MSPPNKVEVEIYGDYYNLKGEASTEYMERIARYVDKTMYKVARRNPKLTLHKAAILAAINIADELLRTLDHYGESEVQAAKKDRVHQGDTKGERQPVKNHSENKKEND